MKLRPTGERVVDIPKQESRGGGRYNTNTRVT
jgi:hypothetical protein